MNERPIIFSGEMVQAILEERKTQTRRVIKPQPSHFYNSVMGKPQIIDDYFSANVDNTQQEIRCPYGKPGDLLWVRETFAILNDDEFLKEPRGDYYEYKADHPDAPYPGEWPADEARGNPDAPKWKPSIFMPREASRITLEITGVRVERVQEIKTADIVAEGILPDERYLGSANRLRHPFIDLWDSLNKHRGYGWEVNSWVWVIEFWARSK